MKPKVHTIAAAAVAFLSLLLLVALPVGQPASANPLDPYPLFFDPGPTTNCNGFVVEAPPNGDTNGAAHQDLSGCAPNKLDPTFNTDSDHSAWDLGTYNWNTSNWNQTPGYSFQESAQSTGGAKTITMKNQATGGDCAFHETNVSYTYVGTQLRPGPDDAPINAGEGGIYTSYNAQVTQAGGFVQCPQKRAILTTDFILYDTKMAKPAVISVVHFDPNVFLPIGADGVQWESGCRTNQALSCRVMVRSPQQLAGNSPATVGDDFGQLVLQYKAFIDPNNEPLSDFTLRGIQIVSSNIGSDTTSTISGFKASITPTALLTGHLTYNAASSMCLDDFHNATQSPAIAEIWPCTQNDNAQNWTMGWDSTLRVNGLCLDASKAGTNIGTPVGLYQCNGGQNQKFVLGRNGELWNPVSQLCLGMSDYGTTAGDTNLVLQICSGQPSQKWSLAA